MSGIQKQLIPISALGFKGIDTKTDSSKLQLGQLIVLENAVFTNPGRLSKRDGYTALLNDIIGSSSSITTGSTCATFQNELDLFTGTEMYSYSPAVQKWSDKGEATSLNLTSTPIIRNSFQQQTPDMAFHPAGILVYTWEDSRGGSRYSVFDSVSGEQIVSDAVINANAARPKPIAVGARVVLLYHNTSNHNLEFISFPALTPASPGGVNTVSSLFNTSNPNYDATVMNNTIFVAFNNSSSGTSVVRIGSNLVVSAHVDTGGAATNCINIAADPANSEIWVTYADGTDVNVYVQRYTSNPFAAVTISAGNPGVVTAPTGTGFFANQPFVFGGSGTLPAVFGFGTTYFVKDVLSANGFTVSITLGGAAAITATPSSGIITFNPQTSVFGDTIAVANAVNVATVVQDGVATIFYEVAGSQPWFRSIRSRTCTNDDVLGTDTLLINTVGIASKPFIYNDTIYLVTAFQSNLQSTYFLLNQSGMVVGKMSPGLGGGLVTKPIIPEIAQTSPGVFAFGSLIKDLLTTVSAANSTAVYTQTGVQEGVWDFTSNKKYITQELANNLHISGGILSVYDGTSVVEHGFSIYPENIVFSDNSGGGGSVAAGTYGYQFCYEWTDNQGNIQRSAPSVEVSYTVSSGSSTVTAVVPCLALTSKTGIRTNVSIVGYRTQANGTVLTQFTSVTSPHINNPLTTTISITDANSDASILGNPPIYTTGGVVENIAAPAVDSITSYRDRLIVVPSENRRSFWYSQQFIPGNTPIQFSDLFVQNIDIRGGDITAVSPLDDKLILFKETEIFYLTGDGPDPTGNNNDFTEAWLITADGGSISPVVVLTPMGLMYKSQKGIYLLDHGLQVSYIGASVAAFNSANVVSANLMADSNQVRFCLDTDVALVYDYFVKEWSVFTNHKAVSSCIYAGNFTYLQAGGTVMTETPGQYTDNGQFIKMKLTTAWMSFAQLTGFQRAYRLMVQGNYASPHQLLVQIAYDYSSIFTQQTYINAAALLQPNTYGSSTTYGADGVYGGAYPNYEFQVYLQQQRCTAFQLSIEDVGLLPYGEGYSISTIGLLVGLLTGFQRLPSSQKFG